MTHALSLRGLAFSYGRRPVLHEIDLELPTGEILGLIGPNGAGKTTMLRILAGQMKPKSGDALVLGDPVRKLSDPVRASLGLVFEATRLPSAMKTRELLDFCRRLHPDWDDAYAKSLCLQLHLDPQQRVRDLSRGMKAKLAIVLAVAYRPHLLLLDEPFGGLDAVAREDVLDVILEQVRETGCSVFLATHDLREVERVADRVAYLDEGDLVFSEATESLLERHRRVRLVLPQDDASLPAWATGGLQMERDGRVVEFVATDATIIPSSNGTSITADPMSLEDIFVAHARSARAGAVQ